MWPFKPRPQPAEAESVTAVTDRERLDDLEDAVAHLNRRFARLQQQVTRWSRDFDEDDDELQDERDEFQDELERRRNA
jgi:predicted  nucleic acid-binding Zn-ribbon protein